MKRQISEGVELVKKRNDGRWMRPSKIGISREKTAENPFVLALGSASRNAAPAVARDKPAERADANTRTRFGSTFCTRHIISGGDGKDQRLSEVSAAEQHDLALWVSVLLAFAF